MLAGQHDPAGQRGQLQRRADYIGEWDIISSFLRPGDPARFFGHGTIRSRRCHQRDAPMIATTRTLVDEIGALRVVRTVAGW